MLLCLFIETVDITYPQIINMRRDTNFLQRYTFTEEMAASLLISIQNMARQQAVFHPGTYEILLKGQVMGDTPGHISVSILLKCGSFALTQISGLDNIDLLLIIMNCDEKNDSTMANILFQESAFGNINCTMSVISRRPRYVILNSGKHRLFISCYTCVSNTQYGVVRPEQFCGLCLAGYIKGFLFEDQRTPSGPREQNIKYVDKITLWNECNIATLHQVKLNEIILTYSMCYRLGKLGGGCRVAQGFDVNPVKAG